LVDNFMLYAGCLKQRQYTILTKMVNYYQAAI
jgi:hypothetical protein